MDEEQKQEFQVIDRRRNREEAKTTSSEPRREVEKEKTVEHSQAPRESRPDASEQPEYSGKVGPITLSGFIMGLASQTMMLLGEIPNPETNLTTVSLEGARQTIDILAMLQDKTKSDVTPEEKALLDEVLAGLRVAYVKKSQSKPS